MPDASTFLAWAESLDSLNYYAILRVAENATPEQVKEAFHAVALRTHPDRYVDEPEEVAHAAARVFKRSAEAYAVLSKPVTRIKYDIALAKGKIRLGISDVARTIPPSEVRTLEMLAKGERAKGFARKADRLLTLGKLDEARVQLITACQDEPHNEELKERLDILYEALALEPL